MTPLLEIQDLKVVYRGRGRRKDKVALDGVTLSVEAGETLGVVGESGSGKSTLGGCVLGLQRPAEGSVVFDGNDITHLSRHERRALSTQIQAVFQDPYSSFNPHRTIEQSVSETLTNVPNLSRSNRRDRVVAMLERVGLDRAALAKFPAQFSGGQRQRIAIARALLPDPRLVVCDEAVSALDLSVQAQVLNLLLELQRERGLAYLFITHDLAVVRHMSTRVAVLEHGNLVEEGDVEQVTERPRQPYTRRLVTASPEPDPDVQEARRNTRKAIADLSAEQENVGDESSRILLHALEWQAVAEVLAAPAPTTPALDRALRRFAENPDDLGRLIELRAAIPKLAGRTSVEVTDDVLMNYVEKSRIRACEALASGGMASQFAAQCRELVAAINNGDRDRALMLVGSMHEGSAAPHRTELLQP